MLVPLLLLDRLSLARWIFSSSPFSIFLFVVTSLKPLLLLVRCLVVICPALCFQLKRGAQLRAMNMAIFFSSSAIITLVTVRSFYRHRSHFSLYFVFHWVAFIPSSSNFSIRFRVLLWAELIQFLVLVSLWCSALFPVFGLYVFGQPHNARCAVCLHYPVSYHPLHLVYKCPIC